jgi:hypothetical protein
MQANVYCDWIGGLGHDTFVIVAERTGALTNGYSRNCQASKGFNRNCVSRNQPDPHR